MKLCLTLCSFLILLSCSKDEITPDIVPTAPVVPITIPAESITFNKKYLNLLVNQSEQITYTFQPSNANETVTWYNNNPDKVSISSTGIVTALSPGIAIVKAIVGGRFDKEIKILVSYATTTSPITGSWQKLTDLPTDCARYGAVSFVIGNKGYIGLGSSFAYLYFYGNIYDSSGQDYSSFKSYNFDTNEWSSIASIPFGQSATSVSFSIGNKAYVGLGGLGNNFWEYDSTTDTWSQLPDFIGSNRENAVSFSVNGKGYVGLGNSINNYSSELSDFWEFNTVTNSWTQLPDFQGGSRKLATALTIDNKAYVGLGSRSDLNGSLFLNDFWCFDPNSNTWSQKANMPIAPDPNYSWAVTGRYGAKAFSINGKGYVGNGNSRKLLPDFEYYSDVKTSDFWEYNPSTNAWILKPYSPNISENTFVFSSSTAGYIGGGKVTTEIPYQTTVKVTKTFHKLIP